MTQEDKQPLPPEDIYPELEDEGELDPSELEELVVEATGEAPTPAAAPTMANEEVLAQITKLEREAEVLKQKLQEKEETYLRLYADFDNFRKRTQREKEELSLRERQKVILEVLPLADNFERAQESLKIESPREEQIQKSYQSVYRLFVEALKKMGVSRMVTVGQAFDPNLHEAMMQEPSTEHAEGTILKEFQAGYKLGDFILRHAMVVVAAPGSTGQASDPAPQTEGTVVAPASENSGHDPATGSEG